MNTILKLREPFAFWLTKNFLTTKGAVKENTQPVSNQELFSVLGMIIAALVILEIVF